MRLPFNKETEPISPPIEAGFVTNGKRWKFLLASSEMGLKGLYVWSAAVRKVSLGELSVPCEEDGVELPAEASLER